MKIESRTRVKWSAEAAAAVERLRLLLMKREYLKTATTRGYR